MKFLKAGILSAVLVSPFILRLFGVSISHTYFKYDVTPLHVLIIYLIIFVSILVVANKKRQ